jgi:hypothetical protein
LYHCVRNDGESGFETFPKSSTSRRRSPILSRSHQQAVGGRRFFPEAVSKPSAVADSSNKPSASRRRSPILPTSHQQAVGDRRFFQQAVGKPSAIADPSKKPSASRRRSPILSQEIFYTLQYYITNNLILFDYESPNHSF